MTGTTEMIAQRSDAWHEQRKRRVTASSVGAILGHDPWRKRGDVMRQMVRDALGAPKEWDGNVATAYGTANEENARFDFELETGIDTDPAPFVEYEDWAGSSPDRFIGKSAILEIKAPYGLRKDPNPTFKHLLDQEQYWDQVQFQSYCTGRDHIYFWQWTAHGNSLTETHADQDWRDKNLPVLRQFYAEFLDELANNFEEHLAPKRITLDSPEAHKMIREWDEIAEQIAWLDERKKDLLKDIVAVAGEKDAEFAGRKLTKVTKAGVVSYAKAFKELMPNANLDPYKGAQSEYWRLS